MELSDALIEAGTAVAIGMLVGFEREHHDLTRNLDPDEAAEDASADPRPVEIPDPALGSRTFAVIALGGWLGAFLADRYAAALPLALLAIFAALTTQYVLAVKRGAPLGITTELAAAVVALLGVAVHVDRNLAVPLALALVLLMIAKPWTRAALVRLRRLEVTSTVQLLVLAALVLPLLPTDPVDPWGAIPPRKVGVFVVLIAGVEWVGYVLHRLLGSERGTGLAGLVGGLASSTAVTAAMTKRSKEHPDLVPAALLATFLANAVMGVRVVVVTAILSSTVALRVAPAMAALVAVLLGGAALQWRRARKDGKGGFELKNPFALIPALTWGAVLCGVLLAAHFATEYLGSQGFLLAAAASGLADVDAITLAASREAKLGTLAIDMAALAIAIAVASNTLVKGGIAVAGGDRRYGIGVAIVFALALAAGGAAAVVVLIA